MSNSQEGNYIEQAINHAAQLHMSGRLPEAKNEYARILESEPGQPVALHLLGVLSHQMGNSDQAIKLIEQALTVMPEYAEAHSNLGNVFREIGRLKAASECYRRALHLAPD